MAKFASLSLVCATLPIMVSASYSLVGHGRCLDGSHHSYEFWYIQDWETSGLTYTTDRSTCSCHECEEVCNSYPGCVGYEFYCCPEGERCLGGGSVLFSEGTRPDSPPGKFSLIGPRGMATAGSDLTGSGPILSMDANTGPDGSCYSKDDFQAAALASLAALPHHSSASVSQGARQEAHVSENNSVSLRGTRRDAEADAEGPGEQVFAQISPLFDVSELLLPFSELLEDVSVYGLSKPFSSIISGLNLALYDRTAHLAEVGEVSQPIKATSSGPLVSPNPPSCLVQVSQVVEAQATLLYQKAQAEVDCKGTSYDSTACAIDALKAIKVAAEMLFYVSGAAFDCSNTNLVCAQSNSDVLANLATSMIFAMKTVGCKYQQESPPDTKLWACYSDATNFVSSLQGGLHMAQVMRAACPDNSIGPVEALSSKVIEVLSHIAKVENSGRHDSSLAQEIGTLTSMIGASFSALGLVASEGNDDPPLMKQLREYGAKVIDAMRPTTELALAAMQGK